MIKEEKTFRFISKTIKVCDRCGRFDIKTYAKFELKDNRPFLETMYSECPRCGYTKEFTKDEIKQELK